MTRFSAKLKNIAITLLILCSFAVGMFGLMYAYMELFLPSVSTLRDVRMQVPLRIMTSDGQLIAEYGDKRRIPINYSQIPKPLLHAVLDTEDQRFFHHSGIDILGLGRATIQLITTGKKSQGGSTITMQVARNFFLSRKKTYYRKFREILLAIKIDHTFTKQKILELYFNKVFLGKHAYGFAAAAQIYYGKPLDQLTLAEYAMLAGLPKAPSSLNPITNPKRAIDRRNHVLERMLNNHHITQAEYEQAKQAPVTASYHGLKVAVKAPYVAELIGNYLSKSYGNDAYSLGLQIYTTINSKQQLAANKAVRNALFAYDKRHGYRGPEGNLGNFFLPSDSEQWQDALKKLKTIDDLQPAAVVAINKTSIQALLSDGQFITIYWHDMAWASKALKRGLVAPKPKQASDVVKIGDVIRVEKNHQGQWTLQQIPQTEGALVAMNPNSGAITALVGGLNFERSEFNRATQAKRQVGSSFKPFIYAAALDKNMTLSTIINDSPVVIKDSGENRLWRPQNDTRKFYGPTRLRVGLIKSRNLVSIRILQRIGIPYTVDYVARFGFDKNQIPHSLSLALGTASITPLHMASAYSVFANGGYTVTPYLINKITNDSAETLYQAKQLLPCPDHEKDQDNNEDDAPAACNQRVLSAQTAYLMTSAMKSVITKGTGRGALILKRNDLAGKTGTTDDQNDAWFAGFNHQLVAIAWVGFDQPASLYEYGSSAALPMWIDFMGSALRGTPESEMPEPTGIVTARINPKTGMLVRPGQKPYLYELFKRGTLPPYDTSAMNSSNGNTSSDDSASITDLY